jgi:1,4-alpha-glucan branching enzyme
MASVIGSGTKPGGGLFNFRDQNQSELWKGFSMARQLDNGKKQTFRFNAATAMSVTLVGDFTHWQKQGIPMRKGRDGVWTASVDLPPGEHHYRFIVDGDWRDDPECTVRVPNPYGGQDMVKQVA